MLASRGQTLLKFLSHLSEPDESTCSFAGPVSGFATEANRLLRKRVSLGDDCD